MASSSGFPRRCSAVADVGHGERPAPSAAIGALAATFGVIEASKIALGAWEETLTSRELYLDAANHQYAITKFDRKPMFN